MKRQCPQRQSAPGALRGAASPPHKRSGRRPRSAPKKKKLKCPWLEPDRGSRGVAYSVPKSMTPNTKKSILAVVAGVLVIIVVTTIVDIVLHAAGVFPPMNVPIDDRLSLIATSYRVLISI